MEVLGGGGDGARSHFLPVCPRESWVPVTYECDRSGFWGLRESSVEGDHGLWFL